MISNLGIKKEKVKIALLLLGAILGFTMVAPEAFAHGYVEAPVKSRARLCYEGKNTGCGATKWNHNGLEAAKGFPHGGPDDGKIASADEAWGPELDEQTETRWYKQDLTGGSHTFTWTLTAPHRTAKWHYYITKKGWNPNEKLKRSDFELIEEFNENGAFPSRTVSHNINIPTDRSGYHIILAVWDIADTGAAFYNVIDVNLKNDTSGPEIPTKPQGLHATKVTSNSVELKWNPSQAQGGVTGYQVFGNGKLIKTVSGTTFTDTELKPNTEYKYSVKAVNSRGVISEESDPVVAKTKEEAQGEAPTQPQGLRSMDITASRIDLMWNPSTSNVGIKLYEIYRNGTKVATINSTKYTDTGLQPNTEYRYTIRAVDMKGNVSDPSNEIKVETKQESSSKYEKWNLSAAYKKGDKVQHKGKIYECVQSYQGKGDPNWIYALSLWTVIE
ncbi:lytic polysaccharide monooxygenase [Paenibacillus larvae]|uniref:Lytic polysaccharide monooxygenase n=1 Tax=Paenibacillus larvae TaxID=1464 RepID=A0AAP5N642_9BACL|nr:lytic polysaccharide monooxygenase [Paenibacillus larvae]AQR76483.1 chitin-binding protein [Paenibacillus larvae subsp. larvae]AVF22673.1 GlcNAc-binding protein A [Paenibacillus larvae subsp. larvae]ETK25752.1 GlcNAc-binding protein A [Paenibacillus larvae subsp. larvae DSM 25719]MCY7476707.1 lytic polysaccharide monooxygenase [Paenibacillus larvae]MCY7490100.1 lytic polysaccharide monooxygenase [Paenibacillus larvae]